MTPAVVPFVRRADTADLDTICAFNAAMALETEGRSLDPGTLRRGVEGGLADSSRARYFVAEWAGEASGCLMLTLEWSDWRAGFWWWIQSVYVRPEARRAGVYRALHAHVLVLARQDPEVVGLRLYVERNNQIAHNTYEALGMHDAHYGVYEQLSSRSKSDANVT